MMTPFRLLTLAALLALTGCNDFGTYGNREPSQMDQDPTDDDTEGEPAPAGGS